MRLTAPQQLCHYNTSGYIFPGRLVLQYAEWNARYNLYFLFYTVVARGLAREGECIIESVLISKLISNCNVKKKSKRIILHGWTLLFPEDMVIEWKQKCNAWDRFPWGNGHWGSRGQQRLLPLPLITCHQSTVRHFKRHYMLGLQDAEKSIIANRPGNYSLFSTGLLSKCL